MALAQVVDFQGIQARLGLNPGLDTVGGIVTQLLPYLFTAAGLVVLLYLLWGGFSWMLSRGDAKAIAAAQSKISSALIGFVIIFLAYWITQLVGDILGIRGFNGPFGGVPNASRINCVQSCEALSRPSEVEACKASCR